MRRLDRYFTGEFIKAFFLALAGLVISVFSWSVLEAMKIESRQPRELLYLYLVCNIPQTVVFVAPTAVIFSVSFTVAQFTMARELVAVFSSGVSFYRSIAGILVFAFGLSVGLIAFQNYVVIPSNRLAADYIERYRTNTRKKLDIVWQKSLRGKNAFYFIQYFDRETSEVRGGFHILTMNEHSVPERMIEAREAKFRGGHSWNLRIVRETRFGDDLTIQDVKFHLDLPLELPEDISFFSSPARNPAEMDVTELIQEIRAREAAGFTALPYRVHLHSTLAFPFMCFIIAVVGAVAGNMGSLRSSGPLIRSLLLSTATFFFFFLAIQLGQNLGENGVLPPWLAGWSPTFFFAGMAAFLVRRHRR